MQLKQHLPLAVATVVISATQILCSAWLVHRMHVETPASSDYSYELHDMQKSLDKIAENTESASNSVAFLDSIEDSTRETADTLKLMERLR